MSEPEIKIGYPAEWEEEFTRLGRVSRWIKEWPDLYVDNLNQPKNLGRLNSRPDSLECFAQYALQYLLRQQGIQSVTWYKLGSEPSKMKDPWHRERTLKYWGAMREIMGIDDFESLRRAIRTAGLKDFDGEPDLFCWESCGHWFFAEAKRGDRLLPTQRKWFDACRKTLGQKVDIRVYRLVQEHSIVTR